MNVKYTIPAIYRANTLSIAAWIWIESALYCQTEDSKMTIMEAARQFQQFWGLEEDDFDLLHIKTCYYRMQQANRERCEQPPPKFPRHESDDVVQALQVLKEFFGEKK